MVEEVVQRIAAMTMVTRGEVSDDSRAYADKQISKLVEHIVEPVLFARVKLTQAPDPALRQPAIAEVTVDINGDIVRSQVGASSMGEAIDLLQARLRRKLEQRAQHRQALRRRAASSPPGEWRHGERPTTRPDFFQRPAEEREVVRHKSHVTHEMTPDEAAFDLEQLDLDFYLFRDIATGDDALLERGSDGSYRLARIRNSTTDSGRPVVNPATAERSAPTLRLDEAIERIGAGGERFVFFENTATGRGSVLYYRYDGHYGLITPA